MAKHGTPPAGFLSCPEGINGNGTIADQHMRGLGCLLESACAQLRGQVSRLEHCQKGNTAGPLHSHRFIELLSDSGYGGSWIGTVRPGPTSVEVIAARLK